MEFLKNVGYGLAIILAFAAVVFLIAINTNWGMCFGKFDILKVLTYPIFKRGTK